jgi:UDP-N-acetyl-D-galactosamine dehydrogenase
VVDIYNTLREYTPNITVYDPWANAEHVFQEYGMVITNELPTTQFDAVILAVAHNAFLDMDVKSFVKDNGVIYDVKGILPRNIIDGRL